MGGSSSRLQSEIASCRNDYRGINSRKIVCETEDMRLDVFSEKLRAGNLLYANIQPENLQSGLLYGITSKQSDNTIVFLGMFVCVLSDGKPTFYQIRSKENVNISTNSDGQTLISTRNYETSSKFNTFPGMSASLTNTDSLLTLDLYNVPLPLYFLPYGTINQEAMYWNGTFESGIIDEASSIYIKNGE